MELKINQKNGYRPEIDGIRAFAVIAVIIFHFNKYLLPSGYLGVDIFFVISGYVITSSLSRRKNKNFFEFIIGFYQRRLKRLLPVLVFFVLITSILISFFNPNPADSLRTGLTSLFGLSNIYLLRQSTDYFGASTELNVFTHTWSLGVEEQFYFLFPFIIWFTGYGQKIKKSSRNLSLIILFLSIISLFSFIFIYQKNYNLAYFLMPLRFWEMSAGCLSFLFFQKKVIFTKQLSKLSSELILLSIFLIMFLPISSGIASTIIVVFLTSVLLGILKKGNKAFNLLTNKKIVNIGLLSYSLYLWHWSIISISIWTIGIYWWTIPFQVLIIYILANLSFRFIEKPFREKVWSNYKFISFLKGLCILFISSTTILTLEKPLKGFLYLGANNYIIDNSWRNKIISVNDNINGIKCNGDDNYSKKKINNLLENCIIKNPKNKKNRTIAFAGDSHTLSLMSSQKMFYDKGFNIIHYSFVACPFPQTLNGLISPQCNEFVKLSSIKVLEKLKEGDYIIIYNYLLSYLGDKSLLDVRNNFYDSEGNLPENKDKKFEIYINSLNRFANEANKKGIKIIFLGATTRYNFKLSSPEWFRPISSSYIKKDNIYAQNLNNKLKKKLEGSENIIFFDPFKEINCCKNLNEYKNFLRDTDHLSEYGSQKISEKLVPIILGE